MKFFKHLKNRINIALFTVLLIFGVSSCYYDYGLATSDYDVIFTHWDKNTDFGTFKTFFLADTIFHLVGENDEDDISRQFDAQILAAVGSNFTAKGYKKLTEIDTNVIPDFFVTISVTKSTYTGGGWYYPPYYPWYPPGWGWYPGYPGYWPGGGYYYSYETGTIFVDFIATEDIDVDNPDSYVVPRWTGRLEGLLSSAESNLTRILNGIDKMFYQSPVLVAGGGDR
jgi:hypothetical protein